MFECERHSSNSETTYPEPRSSMNSPRAPDIFASEVSCLGLGVSESRRVDWVSISWDWKANVSFHMSNVEHMP